MEKDLFGDLTHEERELLDTDHGPFTADPDRDELTPSHVSSDLDLFTGFDGQVDSCQGLC